jgi:molybdopterin-guanine dinucleotide biosynthesis protein A
MTLTAVLFVGGQSRRMGVDKATLVLNGRPLWSRQLGMLRELKPEKILISARTKPAWCPPEMEVVLDEPPSRGPLSGLAAVLKRIQTTHLLALAIDLPRMNAAHLRKLWKLARPKCGVLPSIDGELEPLCAIYPGGEVAAAAAEKALSGPDFSLRSFAAALVNQKQLMILPLADAEKDCHLNVNTAEELAATGRTGKV